MSGKHVGFTGQCSCFHDNAITNAEGNISQHILTRSESSRKCASFAPVPTCSNWESSSVTWPCAFAVSVAVASQCIHLFASAVVCYVVCCSESVDVPVCIVCLLGAVTRCVCFLWPCMYAAASRSRVTNLIACFRIGSAVRYFC